MTATYKILIVDDDPSILEVLDARLSASNFKVLKAKDAAGAEQILKAQKDIDLLVSDIKMPEKAERNCSRISVNPCRIFL